MIASSERTRISNIVPDDAAFILRLLLSSTWLNYIGDRGLRTVEDAKQYIEERFLASYQQHEFGHYLVRLLSGEPIGVAGFFKRSDLDNVDLGFAFMPSYQNQGYGYEVSRALIAYGVTTYDFRVLDAITVEANQPSRALLKKLGFHNTGLVQFGDPPEKLLLYRWHRHAQNC